MTASPAGGPPDAAEMSVTLRVNGAETRLAGPAHGRLLDHLPGLGLTGARRGCGIGRCGACTVLLGGRPVNACLVPLARLDGGEVVTAEGLGAAADPVIAALVRHGAVQCGYCTPGVLVALTAALADPARPDAAEVEGRLTGNLCRCSGYAGLKAALRDLFGPAAA